MSERTLSFVTLLKQNSDVLEILREQDIVLFCRNLRTGKISRSRFSALYRNNPLFWEVPQWSFSLSESDAAGVIDLLEEKRALIKGEINQLHLSVRESESLPPSFGGEYEEIQEMTLEQRSNHIVRAIEALDAALNEPRITAHQVASLMTDAAIYSTVINKVSIEEMAGEENLLAQRYLLQITAKTELLMSSLVEALSRNYNLNHTVEMIMEKTDGVTSRHMSRVFLLSIRFLDELRHEFEYAGLYQRLQSRMKSYMPLYEPLRERYPFTRFEPSTILPGPLRFNRKSIETNMLGILLHDLGKNRNLVYFDGGEGYDRDIIEKHAFDGFRMVREKTVYDQSIASVAGLHHEYYGHEQGYGVFRSTYGEYRKKFPDHSFDAILTNEYNDIVSFKALAYFPAKVLEIVDVYDALIDRERRYKEPLSSGEALIFMRKNMIDRDLKLDPILFDQFIKFLQKAKLI